MCPTDGESNSDTLLTPTNPIEADPSELTFPSVIGVTSDSSSSAVSHQGMDPISFALKRYPEDMVSTIIIPYYA